MKENHMMKVSLIGSLLGLAAIYLVVMNITSPLVNIGEIGGNQLTGSINGNIVKVRGEVKDFYVHKNGHLFFDIADSTGEVRVVIWSDVAEELALSGVKVDEIRDGTVLEITGTLELYKGEPELIPLRSQVKIIGK